MGLYSRLTSYLRTDTGYDGATFKRPFRNWFPSIGSPDGEIIKDLHTLRIRCRDLYRNNAIARGAIKLMISSVIGRGIKPQCVPDREVIRKYYGWNKKKSDEFFNDLETTVEKRFKKWAESKESDSRGQRNFYENQSLAFNSFLQSGEVFAAIPLKEFTNKMFRVRVGLIEADQVQSPLQQYNTRENRDGLVTTNDGTPVGAYINMNQEVYPYQFQYTPFIGSNSGRKLLLHLYRADRPGQSRGVPFLASVIQVLKHLEDYKKSELIRAKVVSYFSVFIKSNNGNAIDSNNIVPESGEQSTESANAEGRDYTLAPASVHLLEPTEEIEFASPGNISQNYGPFSESLMIEIGMSLGIPYEKLRRYYKSTYTAARGSNLDHKKEIQVFRNWFTSEFCRPYYREFFTDEVARGKIDCPGFFENVELREAYLESTWTGDAYDMLDPTKELEAAIRRVEKKMSNMTDETAAVTGGDYSSNLQVLAREKQMRKENGLDDTVNIGDGT